MILKNEYVSFESLERAIVKRLVLNLNLIARQRRQQAKIQNANEVLKLNIIMSNKFYDRKNATRLTTEYLNFLIRFYENKTKKQSSEYLRRFLKALDLNFKNLDTTRLYRNYRKLIHNRIRDYNINDDEDDSAYFENCAVNSHILYSGNNRFHYI